MTEDLRAKAHNLDATLRVGKGGVEAVVDELARQLENRELVKVKFLRAARSGSSTDELAAQLADETGSELVETRGNTGVFH